jgi:hypothetical protein
LRIVHILSVCRDGNEVTKLSPLISYSFPISKCSAFLVSPLRVRSSINLDHRPYICFVTMTGFTSYTISATSHITFRIVAFALVFPCKICCHIGWIKTVHSSSSFRTSFFIKACPQLLIIELEEMTFAVSASIICIAPLSISLFIFVIMLLNMSWAAVTTLVLLSLSHCTSTSIIWKNFLDLLIRSSCSKIKLDNDFNAVTLFK